MRRSFSAQFFGYVFAFAIAGILGRELLPSSVSAGDLTLIKGAAPPILCQTQAGVYCPQCTSNTCTATSNGCRQDNGTPGCGDVGTPQMIKTSCLAGGFSAPCSMHANWCAGEPYNPIGCMTDMQTGGCVVPGVPGCTPVAGAANCDACSAP